MARTVSRGDDHRSRQRREDVSRPGKSRDVHLHAGGRVSDDFRASAPPPGPSRPYHFPRVTRETLPNGLEIWVAENNNAPLVSIRAPTPPAADRAVADLAGLASMTTEL